MFATKRVLHYLKKLGYDLDKVFLRDSLTSIVELLMEFEVSQMIDADHYERNDNRVAYRNGYRKRSWKTPVGVVRLKIPKLRQGSYLPEFINNDTAVTILDLLQRAVIFGVNHDDAYDLLARLDLTILSHDKRIIAELYAHLDEIITHYHQQAIRSHYPCIWLDVVVMPDSRQQLVLAVGIDGNAKFELLDFELSPQVNHVDFWRDFMRKLSARGLKNVKLVISDAFNGVKSAVYEELPDAEWQFSRAHAVEQILRYVPEYQQDDIRVAISTTFVQSNQRSASVQVNRIVDSLRMSSLQSPETLSYIHKSLIAYTMLPSEQQIMMEAVNTLIRIKQAMLGEATENNFLIDAVSRQMISGIVDHPIGTLETDIGKSIVMPMM